MPNDVTLQLGQVAKIENQKCIIRVANLFFREKMEEEIESIKKLLKVNETALKQLQGRSIKHKTFFAKTECYLVVRSDQLKSAEKNQRGSVKNREVNKVFAIQSQVAANLQHSLYESYVVAKMILDLVLFGRTGRGADSSGASTAVLSYLQITGFIQSLDIFYLGLLKPPLVRKRLFSNSNFGPKFCSNLPSSQLRSKRFYMINPRRRIVRRPPWPGSSWSFASPSSASTASSPIPTKNENYVTEQFFKASRNLEMDRFR